MPVRPLHDWLVVKLDELPETTAGGIVLTEGTSGAERVRTGTVLRVGPGRWLRSRKHKRDIRIPVSVSVGERVAFFRENFEHKQGKEVLRIVQALEENTGMIRESDVLYALTEGT